MKKFYICTFNLNTGAIVNLPKLYENREEAILAGQDYVKNRQHEDDSYLFFRVQYTETDSVPENWNLFDAEEEKERTIEDDANEVCPYSHSCFACPHPCKTFIEAVATLSL